MALSDFYTVDSRYKTRIVLHNRNTHGENHCMLYLLIANYDYVVWSPALDLLKKKKVQAIIGSDSTSEAKFLTVLAIGR
ncbi:hypothetical protein OSB04_010354 [Centaurea solstitialis]|uniref:Uncharacterized protein n=1 Tax=Centaurea solstitialis TaxID=347529 RepID=A0AA38WKJ9_9ASTR|nr:hypothetical protein OSB04_010354 [Centaurea solstitialis]